LPWLFFIVLLLFVCGKMLGEVAVVAQKIFMGIFFMLWGRPNLGAKKAREKRGENSPPHIHLISSKQL
jgi:hypothetical protein